MIVCCNGNGHAKDTFLTVYMSTLKGLYDASLGWPLNCTFRLRIVDVDFEVTVNSHARVLDDCDFSTTLGISRNSHYRLVRLNQFKNLPDDCLCIEVCNVSF